MKEKIFLVIALLFIIFSNLVKNVNVTKAGDDCALCVVVGDGWDCMSQAPIGGDICWINGSGTKCAMEGICSPY